MIYLEKAKIGDAEKIVEVRKLAYTDEDIRFGEGRGDYLKYIGNVDFVLWCMDRFLLYKIMLDGIIIGTFWLDHETDDRANHFELQDFCIIPEYQNRGYGAKTIELMEKLHKNIEIWSLETSSFSVRNQYLYEKMGYRRIGQTEDSILYEKIITD
jgi:GNAT superfamily N-acetyltransferase